MTGIVTPARSPEELPGVGIARLRACAIHRLRQGEMGLAAPNVRSLFKMETTS
jgi:hypothetical protein